MTAGKYVPALAWKIHEMNNNGTSKKIPMKGLAIGDGLYDPSQQLDYGDHLYQIGLADEMQMEHFDELLAAAVINFDNGNTKKAAEVSRYFSSMFKTKYDFKTALVISTDLSR